MAVHEPVLRSFLLDLFDTAVRAVLPGTCLPDHLPGRAHAGRTVILAVGKAAAEMAAVAIDHLGRDVDGLVITRHGHGVDPLRLAPKVEVMEAGHPVPDEGSERAARRALALVRPLGAQDRLIALISGGGSALMSLPAPGVSLADKQATTRALLRSGAAISEINCVRKHLSAIKGGRLALAAAPCPVHTLVISDVPGDDPAAVASGPTLADSSTLADAQAVIARYGIDISPALTAALADPANETPKPDAFPSRHGSMVVVATARDALNAAGRFAAGRGLDVIDLGDDLEGEASTLGAAHAAIALAQAQTGEPGVILSGGEATVTVRHADGRGGRNLEYLLALAIALDGAPGISAIACDTDGIDGTEDAAGAIVTPTTLARARHLGIEAGSMLERNESYLFFKALGDLVVTGPTRTNTNDFRAILIKPDPAHLSADRM